MSTPSSMALVRCDPPPLMQSAAESQSTQSEVTATRTSGVRNLKLFDLPQELQDIIFDYAYPPVQGFSMIKTQAWVDREFDKKARDNSYQIRPYPGSKVSEFLVSKQFFEAASKAFMSNQWVDEMEAWDEQVKIRRADINTTKSIVIRHTSNLLSEGLMGSFTMRWFKAIKRMRMKLSIDGFRSLGPRFETEVILDDEEFKRTECFADANEIRGLVSFEAVIDEDDFDSSDAEVAKKAIWTQNVKKFEEVVKPYVLQPKEQEREENFEDIFDTELTSSRVLIDDHMESWHRIETHQFLLRFLRKSQDQQAGPWRGLPESDEEALKMLVDNPSSFLAHVREAGLAAETAIKVSYGTNDLSDRGPILSLASPLDAAPLAVATLGDPVLSLDAEPTSPPRVASMSDEEGEMVSKYPSATQDIAEFKRKALEMMEANEQAMKRARQVTEESQHQVRSALETVRRAMCEAQKAVDEAQKARDDAQAAKSAAMKRLHLCIALLCLASLVIIGLMCF